MECCFASLMLNPIVLAIFAPAWIGSAIWAYRDSRGRNVSRLAVAIVVLLFWPFSFFGWLWLRDRLPVRGDA